MMNLRPSNCSTAEHVLCINRYSLISVKYWRKKTSCRNHPPTNLQFLMLFIFNNETEIFWWKMDVFASVIRDC
jgi:hypothetical protein